MPKQRSSDCAQASADVRLPGPVSHLALKMTAILDAFCILLVPLWLHNFRSLGLELDKLNSIAPASFELYSKNDALESHVEQATKKSRLDLKRETQKVSVFGEHHRIITDSFLGGHRLVEVFEDEHGAVKHCNIIGDKGVIKRVLAPLADAVVTKVTIKEMDGFLDSCRTGKPPHTAPKSALVSGEHLIRRIFIFPGTKWCGAGDIANSYDDLGIAAGTDKCCREHDHSNDSIPALKTRHGIFNYRLHTMTNCNDDEKFYECLMKDGSLVSLAVGKAYFNDLKNECFNFTYPQVCVKRYRFSILLRRCEKYESDRTKPKKWQIFKPKKFLKEFFKRNVG